MEDHSWTMGCCETQPGGRSKQIHQIHLHTKGYMRHIYWSSLTTLQCKLWNLVQMMNSVCVCDRWPVRDVCLGWWTEMMRGGHGFCAWTVDSVCISASTLNTAGFTRSGEIYYTNLHSSSFSWFLEHISWYTASISWNSKQKSITSRQIPSTSYCRVNEALNAKPFKLTETAKCSPDTHSTAVLDTGEITSKLCYWDSGTQSCDRLCYNIQPKKVQIEQMQQWALGKNDTTVE